MSPYHQKNLICLLLQILVVCTNNNIKFAKCKTILPNSAHESCLFDLKQVPSEEPLYLFENSGRYQLFEPENSTNFVASNRRLTLTCPGKRNSILAYNKTVNSQQIQLNCQNGRLKNEKLATIDLKEIVCEKTPSPELKATHKTCAQNSGYIFEVGFELDSLNFIPIFNLCYDDQNGHTFYSEHKINGKAIQHSVRENKRTSFRTSGLSNENKKTIQLAYQKNKQIAHFEDVFGASQKYVNNTMFLARGHLTPDADFIFPSAQLSTYFYVNVAPEFQIVNAGNWKRVENLARNAAAFYKTDFRIYTGTYGLLKFSNHRGGGQSESVFLESSRKHAVPKWFWKVIQNSKTMAAIVMITLNNPYAIAGPVEEFCSNVCSEAGISVPSFTTVARGYTYCCELSTFKNVFSYLPSNMTASKLLDCSFVRDSNL